MSREAKPYWKAQQQRWVCTINGKRITLGAEKKAAFAKFRTLMQQPEAVGDHVVTLYDLSQVYLDWCQKHRAKGTYENHKRYLRGFIDSCGRKLAVAALKQKHITAWLDSFTCTSTSQNDAISIVQRMINWAVKEGHISYSPISKVDKPRRTRREVFYTPEQWEQIKSHAKGPLIDLLDFLWITGCRPIELRTMTAAHVHGSLVLFKTDESKGKKDARVIHLIPEAKAILDRLCKQYPTGPLFRNSRGLPWSKNAIKCRLTRISTKVGFRVIAYGARHSFATNALIRSVDAVSLSHLMGHKSTRMIDNYAHLAQNHEFLQQQARNAAGLSVQEAHGAPSSASTKND